VEICKNEQIQIGLLPVNDPTISYFWFPSYGLSSITVSNPFVITDSTINYQLLISNGSCTDTVFQLVEVNTISVEAGNDTSFCNNPILLQANSNGLVTSFLWSSNNYFSDTLSLDSFLLVSNSMQYYVMVTDGICQAIDSVELKTENIDISLSGIFEICKGDSAFIKVNNLISIIPLIKYQWSPSNNLTFSADSSSVWIAVDSSIWIFVEVQNQDGCELRDSVFIQANEDPISDSIWASKKPIYKGESTTLNIQTIDKVLWETGDTTKQIVVTPTSDSLFFVQVYNDFGCTIYDSIFIPVLDVFCDEDKIKIPTAFTPNNQQPNNTYRILDNDGIITSFKIEIFNRFGQKVYSSTDKLGYWDGTYQNELLAPQVFDFYLELECYGGKKLFKKGNITLIR
jgi:gliding motility-associated-like protein